MIDDGLFEGIDAALLFHPCDRDHVETQPACLGGRRGRLHRASSPTRRLIRGAAGTPSTR